MLNKLFRRNLTTVEGQIPPQVTFEVWADSHMTATTTYTTQNIVTFEVKIDDKGRMVSFRCDDPYFPKQIDLTQRSKEFILQNI